jgi:hypothetical protein
MLSIVYVIDFTFSILRRSTQFTFEYLYDLNPTTVSSVSNCMTFKFSLKKKVKETR